VPDEQPSPPERAAAVRSDLSIAWRDMQAARRRCARQLAVLDGVVGATAEELYATSRAADDLAWAVASLHESVARVVSEADAAWRLVSEMQAAWARGQAA
jgi:hypothetical protein